jgi:hypothetical protein
MEYQRASEEFERFLRAVVENTGLATRNQAYTTVEGVLRLSPSSRHSAGDFLRRRSSTRAPGDLRRRLGFGRAAL